MRSHKLNPTGKADWRAVFTIVLAVPILLVLFLFLYFRPAEQTATSPTVVLATGEYPPFSGETLQDNGIASAIVTSVMREIGYESEIRFLPWPLADKNTKESETNQGVRAAFPYAKTPQREKDFYFSEPILAVETSVFYNPAHTPKITPQTGLDQLSSYKLLPIEGYRYLPAVEKLPQLKTPAEDNIAAFKQLINDPQVQLVAEATAVGNQVLAEHFPRQRYQIQSLPAVKNPLYLIASKRNPSNRELILKFNEALATVTDDQRQAIESAVLTQLDEQNRVLLNAFEASGYINGYFIADGQPGDKPPVRLPKGTRAIVEKWPDAYLNAVGSAGANDATATAWSTVRILNGPLRQEILYVDSRVIELP